jgi:phosphoglycolate phosphatase
MSVLTVVFDLDGTLVDTAPDLVATLNIVIAREEIPAVPFDVGRLMVGFGARRMIELAAERAGRTLSQVELERMFNAFIAHYAAHIADHSKPFPGVAAALDALSARGCRLAVCTNKRAGLSRLLLEELALASRFAAICGPDTFGMGKPDPAILQRTIAAAGGRPDRAVLVGDSHIDAQTAKAAAVPMIAVDFGYTNIPAAELGVARVIGHFDQLPGTVFELFAERG